ncbi:MAG: HAMP domain-containing histidine kinase [Planctomycetes bacterium]|nr:HAMP domain-containing histidine kinase [Planctomycetota bacterium]
MGSQTRKSDATRRLAASFAVDRLWRQAAFLQQPLARFVLFRWVAAGGVLVAPLVLDEILGLHIPLTPTSAIAAGLAVTNAVYLVLLDRMEKAGWSRGIQWMGPLQACLDLLILSVLLFMTGGIRNPLLMFFVFHVIITGILFERAVCFAIALFGMFLVAVECAAEFLLPGLSPDIFTLGPIAAPGHFRYIACILGAFSITLLVTAYLTCDIAARLRREEKRLAAATEHLARLEEAKSRLLHFVAHEMKSPLVAITSCVQAATAVLKKEEGLPPAALDMLDRAQRRSAQMGSLVRELLELSHLQSMPETAARDRVDLRRLLQVVLDDQQQAAEEQGIALCMPACEAELHVLGDSEPLHRAFGNLVSNAIQYTPPGGKVTVTVERNGDEAKVIVADSGIGIPEKDLENIFQEFHRCANAKKVSRIGTGLGLAIVKTIVENHNGRIAVESNLGQGSAFTVWLPIADQEIESEQRTEEERMK